ncbi:hypothetical protein ACFL59_03675 [Planctomycetota bacterium]
MYGVLSEVLDRLERNGAEKAGAIAWGCPVLSFGDPAASRVATLGLNPSNREFVDQDGKELCGTQRRFHTLGSLNINSWRETDARHLRVMIDSFHQYFTRNPYDRWFGKLDQVLMKAGASYYGTSQASQACHLDVVPYATLSKWSLLTGAQRRHLLRVSNSVLGILLRQSPIRVVVLNGRAVAELFEAVAQVRLKRSEIPTWALPRRSGRDIMGVAFEGVVDVVAGVRLYRAVHVFGFNHNIQSSFGVTRQVMMRIGDWIASRIEQVGL